MQGQDEEGWNFYLSSVSMCSEKFKHWNHAFRVIEEMWWEVPIEELHPISNRLGYFQSWKPCIERSKVQLQHKWIHQTATKKNHPKIHSFKNSHWWLPSSNKIPKPAWCPRSATLRLAHYLVDIIHSPLQERKWFFSHKKPWLMTHMCEGNIVVLSTTKYTMWCLLWHKLQ